MAWAVIAVRNSGIVGNGAPSDGAILRQAYKGGTTSGCLLNLSVTCCSILSPEGQLAGYCDQAGI